jgi:DNA-directed RNA polymerase specialized sigma24 family protein
VLNVKTNAVEVALHRALQALRDVLDGGGETEGKRSVRSAE